MKKVSIESLKEITLQALVNIGHCPTSALIIRDTLIYAELRGNNQGLIKLVSGYLQPPKITSPITKKVETAVSANIDGGQNVGMVVVSHSVDLCIEKAKAYGIGIVGCSNYSSATGALGVWAKKITEKNLIGIVMSQCNEMVAPHGSFEPIFGTNPIAIGVPTLPRPQILDMATSASAYFGIKMAEQEGKSIPDDVAYDIDGKPTTNPSEALKGAIRVFDRSFKGSHLALMIELLAGALPGAAMDQKTQSCNWGSLIIAIDPNLLGPISDFQQRASVMCERVKNAKKIPTDGVDSETPIYLPGERGDIEEATNIANGSVNISNETYTKLLSLAVSDKSSIT